METWFMILVSLCFCALLQSLFTRLKPTNRHSLPPGPTAIPIISSLSWLLKSFSELEPILRRLRAKYGPVVTLQIGSRPAIFIATHSLAHQALVQNGAVFADRPPAFATSRVISSNQHNISSASYGPTWRLLRRNLTSEILHPSRVKSYSHARRWVLDILINSLKPMSTSNQRVRVKDHIQYAMFCLLVLMCFGDKLEENKIKQVEEIQRIMLLSFRRFNLLNFWPSLTKILFRKRSETIWNQECHENLSWNNLESRMPRELGYFQRLTVLDLRNSALVGLIPADICESGSLNILQLDGNSLMGQIPEEIGNCSSLYLLSLAQNNLSGSIPQSISRLNKLKILKLEFNELTGEIPQKLGILENLLAVNISYNKIVGRLPVGGIFLSLDQSALQGNLGICSPLLKGPCKMNVPKPLVLDPYAYGNQGDGKKPRKVSSHPARFHHHMFLSISTIIAISAAIFILFGVILISLLNLSVRKRLAFVDHAMESMCLSSSRSGILSTGKLVLFDSKSSPDWISNPEALLNKAAEIGQGVFGTVYKVSLGSEARMVAIKKLFTPNIIQYPEDFDREVQVLGKARHPNLLSLKGYYWTPQLQLLVSEYAPNGSLQAKLHERIPSTPRLSWANRFKIVLGTAKGLAHLHHSFRPPIIHYNIRPSNILLDENLNPKISDFGLARLLTKLDRHVMLE